MKFLLDQITQSLKMKNDIITFKSQSGIAELSYNDVEELIKLKKPFFLIPSYKAQKKEVYNKSPEKILVLQKNQKKNFL